MPGCQTWSANFNVCSGRICLKALTLVLASKVQTLALDLALGLRPWLWSWSYNSDLDHVTAWDGSLVGSGHSPVLVARLSQLHLFDWPLTCCNSFIDSNHKKQYYYARNDIKSTIYVSVSQGDIHSKLLRFHFTMKEHRGRRGRPTCRISVPTSNNDRASLLPLQP